MIQEAYVSFEVSKLLKEKRFNEQCRAAYTNYGKIFTTQIQQYITNIVCSKSNLWECTAPTHQMAMAWLREVHNIQIELNWNKGNQLYSFQIWKLGKYQPEISSLDLWRIYKDDNYLGEWNYEETVEEAIKYCLENLI